MRNSDPKGLYASLFKGLKIQIKKNQNYMMVNIELKEDNLTPPQILSIKDIKVKSDCNKDINLRFYFQFNAVLKID